MFQRMWMRSKHRIALVTFDNKEILSLESINIYMLTVPTVGRLLLFTPEPVSVFSLVTWTTGRCRCTLRSTGMARRTLTGTGWLSGTRRNAWREVDMVVVVVVVVVWAAAAAAVADTIKDVWTADAKKCCSFLIGPVFGNKDNFTGLGVFVDTYPNEEKQLEVCMYVCMGWYYKHVKALCLRIECTINRGRHKKNVYILCHQVWVWCIAIASHFTIAMWLPSSDIASGNVPPRCVLTRSVYLSVRYSPVHQVQAGRLI